MNRFLEREHISCSLSQKLHWKDHMFQQMMRVWHPTALPYFVYITFQDEPGKS